MKVRKVTEFEVPSLGHMIRTARYESGKTMLELCHEADMCAGNWYKIEVGQTKYLPLETLRRIEQALQTNFGVE